MFPVLSLFVVSAFIYPGPSIPSLNLGFGDQALIIKTGDSSGYTLSQAVTQ